ncbi:MAG: CDP-alcohol phosphatidyltransferase family protein [Actinomycetota bacterium]
MFDDALRRRSGPLVDRLARPLVRRGVGPDTLTSCGLAVGLGAAVTLALEGPALLAAALFLANRGIDGLDGAVARRRVARRPGDGPGWGGVWDHTADVIVYVAVPVGLAMGRPELWSAAAVLCATIAVNLVTVLAAAQPIGGRSVALRPGLVEGSETIVAYTVIIAVPAATEVGMWVFAAAVGLTAAERLMRLRWPAAPSDGPGPHPPP